MDRNPENERKIFGEIVRAASLPNCPQYFVITPKLLTGLEYNDCVKTHFVSESERAHHRSPAVAVLCRRAPVSLVTPLGLVRRRCGTCRRPAE
jgi:hypothetical protein